MAYRWCVFDGVLPDSRTVGSISTPSCTDIVGAWLYIREAFSTTQIWTLVRFVSGVCSAMDGQGAALDECFLTRLVITRVWSLVCMYTVVPLKVRLPVEALL